LSFVCSLAPIHPRESQIVAASLGLHARAIDLGQDAQALLKCSDEDMATLISRLENLFQVVGEGYARAFTIYHKTVLDWFLDDEKRRKNAYVLLVAWFQGEEIPFLPFYDCKPAGTSSDFKGFEQAKCLQSQFKKFPFLSLSSRGRSDRGSI
jgi:hypothetical protein